jgi:hypothetical protein
MIKAAGRMRSKAPNPLFLGFAILGGPLFGFDLFHA